MIIYLVRHGQDDDTCRGGWSNHTLTSEGFQQSENLAIELYNNINKYNITKIYSSDLIRAQQTAKILADKIDIPIHFTSEFMEVNNGDLAGLKNEIANIKFPNLYWRKLEWDEHYPNGESPKEFYERIKSAWNKLIKTEKNNKGNIILVTHGGVINIIKSINLNQEYSNKIRYKGIESASLIPINLEIKTTIKEG